MTILTLLLLLFFFQSQKFGPVSKEKNWGLNTTGQINTGRTLDIQKYTCEKTTVIQARLEFKK